MQRSWLQWVAAGDQWYLNKLGMECCLIYQGEPSLTWVGTPGDISFPWVLNCCGQQDTNSWDSWITQGLYTRLEWEFGIACTLLNITAVTGSVLLHGHAPGKTASAGETWGSLLHLLLAPFFSGAGGGTKERKEWALKRYCLLHGFGNVIHRSSCHPSVFPPSWGMRAELVFGCWPGSTHHRQVPSQIHRGTSCH